MDSVRPFDVFRRENGTLEWLGPCPTFEQAKTRIQELGATHPGTYMIFSQRNGTKVEITVAASAKAAAAC